MTLGDRKLHILRHALGLSDSGGGREYRNYYDAPTGGLTLDACNELAHAGLLEVTPGTGGRGFSVTAAGKALAFWQPPGGDQTAGDFRVEWVERFTDRKLTTFQRNAVALMCSAKRCGPYDFTSTWRSAEWDYGNGVRFKLCRPQLATVDSDGLTVLVVGAHELAIRVEIDPLAFHYLAITMHPRERQTDGMGIGRRHPSMEQALAARNSIAV
jgi:hypothetical protein